MNRQFASIVTIATTTAAIACVALIASSHAYAETPTIDTTPFVSTRTRAEVQAELMSQRDVVRAAANEWTLQRNHVPQLMSGYTSEQARAEYQAARDEVSAITSEDSGSSYFARQMSRKNGGITVARAPR